MIETDLTNGTFINNNAPHSKTLVLLYFNFKVGIQKKMDLELISNACSFRAIRTYVALNRPAFPDLTYGYKLNIPGNDSGATSTAIMPFVTTSNFDKGFYYFIPSNILFLCRDNHPHLDPHSKLR